jgi:hypothetical protein
MRTKLAVVFVGVGLLLAAVPVWAHHAFSAEFDVTKPLTLQGTLTKWEMINPHSWFHIEVKDPDGKVVSWMVEGGSPNQLIRLGVTKHTVTVGTEVIIEGYHAKDGSNKAVGRNFTLSDGQRLFLGGSAPGALGPGAEKK